MLCLEFISIMPYNESIFKQSKLKYTLLYMEDINEKIAIIEDDTDICNMITKFLINHNYEVYSAPNGREGNRPMPEIFYQTLSFWI